MSNIASVAFKLPAESMIFVHKKGDPFVVRRHILGSGYGFNQFVTKKDAFYYSYDLLFRPRQFGTSRQLSTHISRLVHQQRAKHGTVQDDAVLLSNFYRDNHDPKHPYTLENILEEFYGIKLPDNDKNIDMIVASESCITIVKAEPVSDAQSQSQYLRDKQWSKVLKSPKSPYGQR